MKTDSTFLRQGSATMRNKLIEETSNDSRKRPILTKKRLNEDADAWVKADISKDSWKWKCTKYRSKVDFSNPKRMNVITST